MDANKVAELIETFANKKELTGFEYMAYMRLCELMETISRRINKNLLEDLNGPDDASS
jgi:hypothetical protein